MPAGHGGSRPWIRSDMRAFRYAPPGWLRWGTVLVVLFLAVASRWALLADGHGNFDADEALVAQQAADILMGQRPLFLPGQSYMGSLQSAVAAGGMLLFGHSPTAVRMAPLLWVLPGFGALLWLRSSSPERHRRRIPSVLLFSQWMLPPAVLFLSSVKLRGGNLESLVLVLGCTAIVWQASARARVRSYPRLLLAGALMGVAVWTHDQALLGLPLIALLLTIGTVRGRWLSVPLFGVGAAAGYLPFWWPRVASAAMGPPGLEGAGAAFGGLEVPSHFGKLPSVLREVLLAGGDPSGAAGAGAMLLIVATAIACLWLLADVGQDLFRRRSPDPLAATVLSLALANAAALLLQPGYFEDVQWFRYTLFIAPALVVARAGMLALLGRWPRILLHGALLALTWMTYAHCQPGWHIPHRERDVDLVARLIDQDIGYVQTDWTLASPIRFWSRGRILAVGDTPDRYPFDRLLISYHPESHNVRRLIRSPALPAADIDVSNLYEIALRRRRPPPPGFLNEILRLEPHTTLIPHYEPFPLLEPGQWECDWRGWPPQRPLRLFEAIVWRPRLATHVGVDWGALERRIESLVASGTFVEIGRWRDDRVFRRAGPAEVAGQTVKSSEVRP